MSEKRFFTKINNKGRLVIIDKECHTELFDMTLACEVLNRLDLKLKTYNGQLGEQQATIEHLQAQLREKEEDEQLYANEIVKLNKEAKEVLEFKSLGGDY